MAIKHTLVQPGDIIETDNSWCIDHVDRDDQSYKPSAHTDCVHDVKVIGNKIWDKPPVR